ncbi:NAC transcription factor 32-like [Cornus florida]|uniref:NAC transcription factor 32-like n=1 Tax=Cornus florida TaxID=4283 RepID=UPI00289BE921|nr:NAC transcription factor 32-like [Cornus florida]
MENQVIRQSGSPRSQPQLLNSTARSQQEQRPNSFLINKDINGGDDEHGGDLDSFPPGYRFRPYDEELVEYYLRRKVKNLILPPNRIHEVDFYRYTPDELAVNYQAQGEKEWYFFTQRDRKYPNGKRPNRTAGNGFWRATSADKVVKFNGRKIGNRKALAFYQGNAQNKNKTSWLMQEFTLYSPSTTQREQNNSRLDEWVLCKIYKKEKDRNRNHDNIEQPIMRATSEETESEPTEMDTDHYSGINEDIEQPMIISSAGNNSTALTSEETVTEMDNMANFNTYGTCAFGFDQPLQTTQFLDSLSFDQFNNHQSYYAELLENCFDQPLQTTQVLDSVSFDQFNNPQSNFAELLQSCLDHGLTEDLSSLLEDPCLEPSLHDVFP